MSMTFGALKSFTAGPKSRPRLSIGQRVALAVVLAVALCEAGGLTGSLPVTPSHVVTGWLGMNEPPVVQSAQDAYAEVTTTYTGKLTKAQKRERAQILLAMNALKFAADQVGKPYIAATRGPNSYDCSGLTFAAYRAAGLNWPFMTSYNQRTSKWVKMVKPGEERPGDLIFYDFLHDASQIPRGLAGPNGVDHVGLVLDPRKGTSIEAIGGRGVVVHHYRDTNRYVPQVISIGRVVGRV